MGLGSGADTSYQNKVSYAVIEAISSAEGVEPTELSPPAYPALHEVIDPQALDTLFETAGSDTEANVAVSFKYCGYQITVDAAGTVELES